MICHAKCKNVTVFLSLELNKRNSGTSLELDIVQYTDIMPLTGMTTFLSLELNREKYEVQVGAKHSIICMDIMPLKGMTAFLNI